MKEDVDFYFRKNGSGMYEYNSKTNGLNYTEKTAASNARFVVGSSIGTSSSSEYWSFYDNYSGTGENRSDKYGFFPWDYVDNETKNSKTTNYGYAAKFEIPFTMTSSGKDKSNNDLVFEFSGDDDVWVFIDDKLALDVGGAHGEVSGSINFGDKTVTTNIVKSSTYYNHNDDGSYSGTGPSNPGFSWGLKQMIGTAKYNELFGDSSLEHTLTVFYIERGTWESNCRITFNLTTSSMLSVRNNVHADHVNAWFRDETVDIASREGFQFKIAGNAAYSESPSPDSGKDPNGEVTTKQKYTVSFTSQQYSSYQVESGTTVKLPDGHLLNDPTNNKYVVGWKIAGSTDNNVYTKYTVNSNVIFTPWYNNSTGTVTPEPVTSDTVPKPVYSYLSTYNSQKKSGRDGNYFKDSKRNNHYFANLTSKTAVGICTTANSGWDHPNNTWNWSGHSNGAYKLTGDAVTAGKATKDASNNLALTPGYYYKWTTNPDGVTGDNANKSTVNYCSTDLTTVEKGTTGTYGDAVLDVIGTSLLPSSIDEPKIRPFIKAHINLYHELLRVEGIINTKSPFCLMTEELKKPRIIPLYTRGIRSMAILFPFRPLPMFGEIIQW